MSTQHKMRLCRYSVASGDMYYTELGLRDVMVSSDEMGNFYITGETVGNEASTAVELCEIFLEYAMYCCTWWEPAEAFSQMRDFAQYLGHSVGRFLQQNTCLTNLDHPCDCALEHLLQAINAQFSVEYAEGLEHFIVTDCPLEKAAQHSGLRNIELAHYGINIMCQSLVEAIEPEVTVKTTPEFHPEFDFIILRPEFA